MTATSHSAGARFRAALAEHQPLPIVGAINPYCAMMAERVGHKALYLAGGGLATYSHGLPDLAITNLSDVLTEVRRLTDASSLPLLVDVDTGFVKLLKHWTVEDCGRVLNPMLVDEQMRGAIVQGIGGALFEECLYDDNGLMVNASMADYLVPMSAEMPDIVVAHIQTPTASSKLGAKGAGEAGTAGAPAAVMNAINDALAPFDTHVFSQPITPQKVLRALGKVA